MNLVRIDPFRDIRTLHSRFDRLFNNAFVHQPSVAPMNHATPTGCQPWMFMKATIK